MVEIVCGEGGGRSVQVVLKNFWRGAISDLWAQRLWEWRKTRKRQQGGEHRLFSLLVLYYPSPIPPPVVSPRSCYLVRLDSRYQRYPRFHIPSTFVFTHPAPRMRCKAPFQAITHKPHPTPPLPSNHSPLPSFLISRTFKNPHPTPLFCAPPLQLQKNKSSSLSFSLSFSSIFERRFLRTFPRESGRSVLGIGGVQLQRGVPRYFGREVVEVGVEEERGRKSGR